MAISEKHQQIAATISEDLRKQAQETIRLRHCEHERDFDATVNEICSDLMIMVAKYQTLMQELYATPAISEKEVNTAIQALLEQLPADYPPAKFSKTTTGYQLVISHTTIFRDASGEDAIKHTQNYVEARKSSPNLPIGVIYGIYD